MKETSYDARNAQVLEVLSVMNISTDEAARMAGFATDNVDRMAAGNATMGELAQLAKGIGVPLIMFFGDRYEALSPDWHK